MIFVGPAVGWIWKAVNLRSDVIDDYEDKLPMTQAALDEQAAKWMRKLADDIGTVLGDPEAGFDPSKALASPSVLRGEMDHVDKLLRGRQNVARYHRWLCRVGPVLAVLGVVYLVAASLAVMYYSEVNRWRGWAMRPCRAVVLAGCSALVVGVYWILKHRFDSARLLASKEPMP